MLKSCSLGWQAPKLKIKFLNSGVHCSTLIKLTGSFLKIIFKPSNGSPSAVSLITSEQTFLDADC